MADGKVWAVLRGGRFDGDPVEVARAPQPRTLEYNGCEYERAPDRLVDQHGRPVFLHDPGCLACN